MAGVSTVLLHWLARRPNAGRTGFSRDPSAPGEANTTLTAVPGVTHIGVTSSTRFAWRDSAQSELLVGRQLPSGGLCRGWPYLLARFYNAGAWRR